MLYVGLQMRRGEAAEALQHSFMYGLGLVTILFATPFVGRLVLAAGVQPVEFAYGLAVFCCMPTSLSANIALAGVRRGFCATHICFVHS
jgi:solute carrier family 10 (sodium/bile acid cotransporter), member 7